MSYPTVKMKDITLIKTGKLDSNAAVDDGAYPFFTCDPNTLKINNWAYDTEAVLLAGNNASGNYTAKYYKGKFNAYQRVYIIETADPLVLNIRYLCYALNQQLRLLKTMSSGSTTKFLTLGMLHGLDIPLPSIKVQEQIVYVLAAYDDLIENNQKQIKLLEEAAQRLYKEWFADLRFPGYETTPITDDIPVGWHIDELGSIAVLKAGGDKPKFFSKEKTEACFVPVFSNGTENEGLYGYTNYAEIADACVTISARGSVGYACLRKTAFVPIVRLISVIPKQIEVEYLFYFLKNMVFESNGAAQQQITVPMIKGKQIVIPSKSVMELFIKQIRPMMDYREVLKGTISTLIEARDRLLPKLMNREIEV